MTVEEKQQKDRCIRVFRRTERIFGVHESTKIDDEILESQFIVIFIFYSFKLIININYIANLTFL